MSEPDHRRLTAGDRRRMLWAGVVRPLLTMLVFGAAYFLLPWTALDSISAIAVACAGLLAAGLAAVWQVWRILRSAAPALQAIEAFVTIVPLYLLAFASVFVVMSTNYAGSFSEPLSRMSSLYFTLTVFSTVGFGDIVARTDSARAAVSVQIVLNLIVIGVGIRVILAAVAKARENKPVE